MASSEKKRKGSSSLPDWVTKHLQCPVCLESIQDPPIYLCEKGHPLCQTCRDPLKAQEKPCPVCRGKLTDVRNMTVENMLQELPKTKCKNEGCAFQRSNVQLVKSHENKCTERPIKCEICLEPIALSKLVGHLESKHNKACLEYSTMGVEQWFWTKGKTNKLPKQHPLRKVNDLQFIFNWASYDENVGMFWVSFCGPQKGANEYEYTVKIASSEAKKAGRSEFLASATMKCISCDMSHEEVKRKAAGVLFPEILLDKAREGGVEKRLDWTLTIKKK